MKCEKCGQPSDGWPGDAGELCQMCREAYCSVKWWEFWGAEHAGGKE